MANILIVEDHEVLRDGLKCILKEYSEIENIIEASNGAQAMSQVAKNPVDLVLLDLNLPDIGGVELTRSFKELDVPPKVLILSMLDSARYVDLAMEAGADGYAVKSIGKTELILAIKKVMRGQLYISSEINAELVNTVQEPVTPITSPDSKLSKREKEVLKLIAEGLTNKEIATRLFTSKRTIESHRKNLIRKTGSKNTASLIHYAMTHGFLTLQTQA